MNDDDIEYQVVQAMEKDIQYEWEERYGDPKTLLPGNEHLLPPKVSKVIEWYSGDLPFFRTLFVVRTEDKVRILQDKKNIRQHR